MTKKEIKQKEKTEIEMEKLRHNNKMLEIETERQAKIKIIELNHDLRMQEQRIKTAEIKRAIDRKANRKFMEDNRYR